jgi:hypothetical protein
MGAISPMAGRDADALEDSVLPSRRVASHGLRGVSTGRLWAFDYD